MRPVGWSWAGFFRPEITEIFSAHPEPGPSRKMFRSTCSGILEDNGKIATASRLLHIPSGCRANASLRRPHHVTLPPTTSRGRAHARKPELLCHRRRALLASPSWLRLPPQMPRCTAPPQMRRPHRPVKSAREEREHRERWRRAAPSRGPLLRRAVAVGSVGGGRRGGRGGSRGVGMLVVAEGEGGGRSRLASPRRLRGGRHPIRLPRFAGGEAGEGAGSGRCGLGGLTPRIFARPPACTSAEGGLCRRRTLSPSAARTPWS
jgi:hypothetical protein